MNSKESINLISSFLFSFLVAFSSFDYIFLFPLLIVLISHNSHIYAIAKKLIFLNFFIVILVLFVYFQNEKEAFELLIKTNLILLFNIALFFSSKGYDIVRGLDALGFSKKIVSIFYFTLSLINYLNNDIRIKRKALSSRGFKSTTSMFTYETYGNIFAMIIIKALRKSDEMKLSMKARGFAGEIYFLNKRRANLLEWTLFLSTLIVLIKVVYELYA